MKKEIVYPILLECCQYTKDIFWENIFEDLAYGRPPYGTYISKDFLCCGYKKKDFSYKIERKDTKKIYEEIYSLLTKKLGLMSQHERIQHKQTCDNLETNMRETRKDWKSIRKKNLKELLIELYVTKMKTVHSLSIKQSRHLLSILFLAMIFKVITAKDIMYSNGRIQKINGIDFEHQKVIVERDIYKFNVSFAPNIVLDKKIMSDNWEKYLKDIRKIAESI